MAFASAEQKSSSLEVIRSLACALCSLLSTVPALAPQQQLDNDGALTQRGKCLHSCWLRLAAKRNTLNAKQIRATQSSIEPRAVRRSRAALPRCAERFRAAVCEACENVTEKRLERQRASANTGNILRSLASSQSFHRRHRAHGQHKEKLIYESILVSQFEYLFIDRRVFWGDESQSIHSFPSLDISVIGDWLCVTGVGWRHGFFAHLFGSHTPESRTQRCVTQLEQQVVPQRHVGLSEKLSLNGLADSTVRCTHALKQRPLFSTGKND